MQESGVLYYSIANMESLGKAIQDIENGKFTVTVEFENDGKIFLGMTANVTI